MKVMTDFFGACAMSLLLASAVLQGQPNSERLRARDLGLVVGVLPTGTLDAITDSGDGLAHDHQPFLRRDTDRGSAAHPEVWDRVS